MPFTSGRSKAPMLKVMTICPLALGVMLLKYWSMALYSPPVVAKISKLVRTWVPLMRTLNCLFPAAVK